LALALAVLHLPKATRNAFRTWQSARALAVRLALLAVLLALKGMM
jgi:hypothetical protein